MPNPDRSFMKDLKNLDSRLSVKFNGEHMVVTYDRGHGDPVNIHRVKADDNGFRQPDKRDLKIIKGGDLEGNTESMKNRLNRLSYNSQLMRRKALASSKENVRNMTRDDKNYLTRKISDLTNIGKNNSAFRRVTPK